MSTYPCHVCANTMLPGVTYTLPRNQDSREPSCGKLVVQMPLATAAVGLGTGAYGFGATPQPPRIIECHVCKGTGMVDERRGRTRRQNSDRRASQAPAVSDPHSVREALSDKQIADAVFTVLRGYNDDAQWSRFTYEHGPYDVTALRSATLDICRAVERAALSQAAVPAVSAPEPSSFCKLGQKCQCKGRDNLTCPLWVADRAAVPAPDSRSDLGNPTERPL